MKTRVGVVGAGTYGQSLIQAFYSAHLLEEIDFAAVADLDPAALEKTKNLYGLAGYTDYKEMFDKEALDAVAVVTPDYLHKEIAVEAADRKIHVLVQKPLATDVEEGRAMIEAAEKNQVMLYVDFHKRFDPGHIHLKQAVEAGKLGEIQYGYVYMEDVILVPSVWFKKWAQHSSPAWFLGIHFYDLLYWILGKAPLRVYATGIKRKLCSLGIDTYDSLQAKFEYENGTGITVDTSWILPNNFCSTVNQGIRLVGSEGMQEVDSQDRGVVACYASEASNLVLNPYSRIIDRKPIVGSVPTGYTIESMLYFLKLVSLIQRKKMSLRELEGHYPSGKEALVSTQMCAAVHESVETKKMKEIKC
jgi:predicted dehydrogenase